MSLFNNTEHMRQLIQLVESHIELQEVIKAPTPEERKLIRQYRQEGKSNTEIDQLLNKTKHWTAMTISNYMRDLLQRSTKGLTVTDVDKEQMSQEFQQGKSSINQIAKKHGIAGRTLQKWLIADLGQEEVARLQARYTSPDRKWTQKEKDWAAEQYANGVGPAAIAAVFMKNIDRLPPGTEEIDRRDVHHMLSYLPNYQELKNQYQSNKNLRREPAPFTTTIYRAGRIDPEGRQPDWRVGKGYK
jgi:hypothetical protein